MVTTSYMVLYVITGFSGQTTTSRDSLLWIKSAIL